VRRLLGRSNWFILFYACASVFFLAAFLLILRMVYSVDSVFVGVAGGTEQAAAIGVMLGVFAGLQMLAAGENARWAVQHWRGMRTERLMLRFHDELKRVRPNCEQAPGTNSG
jgi:hypothetical protein